MESKIQTGTIATLDDWVILALRRVGNVIG